MSEECAICLSNLKNKATLYYWLLLILNRLIFKVNVYAIQWQDRRSAKDPSCYKKETLKSQINR